ncbi:MAG: penicillin acylase family protein [Pseudomonadota bacterium]
MTPRLLRWLGVLSVLWALTCANAAGNDAARPHGSDVGGLAPATVGAVRVIWDEAGVPHIYSKSDEAGFYGFGWSQMEARGDLILELYARARGEAAAISGADHIPADILTHSFAFPERAETWFRNLNGADRRRLVAFADGMNAWANAHADKVPERLRSVLPLRPSDPLAHFYQIIHVAFIGYEELGEARGRLNARPGSNAYAIAPSRSESGSAMLVANPHLPWSDLYTWIEAQLSVPAFDIYGVALAGSPFIGIGFNQHGGWTHTVNHYDGIDVYDLTLKGDGYEFDGEVRTFEKKSVALNVRQEDGTLSTFRKTIKYSDHGPVLFEANGRAYAVRFAALDSDDVLDQYFDMAAAKTLKAFEKAQARLEMPFFNTLYANREGDIYYLHGGRTPKRKTGDWAFWRGIVPGDSSEFVWTEYLPYSALPRLINPQSGFLQNANEPPWYTTFPRLLHSSDYPAYIAPPTAQSFRAQRSLRYVVSDAAISFEELTEFKESNTLEMARLLAPLLVRLGEASSDPDARLGARILKDWDKAANADSRGAILFIQWADIMRERSGRLLREAFGRLDNLDAEISFDAHTQDVMSALIAAVQKTRDKHGDPRVAYGDVVRLRLGDRDYPASGAEGAYGAYRVIDTFSDGQGKKVAYGGESFVAVIEFGERVRAVGNLTYGNTSDPSSPFFAHGLELYAEGQLRPMLFYDADVAAGAVVDRTLQQTPNR